MKPPREKSCHEEFHCFSSLPQVCSLSQKAQVVLTEQKCQLTMVRPNPGAGAPQATTTMSCSDTTKEEVKSSVLSYSL